MVLPSAEGESMSGGAKVFFALLAIFVCAMTPSLHAEWIENGVPVCVLPGGQGLAKITADGSKGAIIAWLDDRNGGFDIYAQRIDSEGESVWPVGGVLVCTTQAGEPGLEIMSDGSGGAIIVWLDYRSGSSWDIYAKHIDANGVPGWAQDGAPLCTASGDQYAPVIASDGSGGAIIAWVDLRNGYSGAYAQRIDSNGEVKWAQDGMPFYVGTYLFEYFTCQIVSDGAGGAIVTWPDVLNPYSVYVRAQRIDASGSMKWQSDGVELSGTGFFPQIASDGNGGAVIAWDDHRRWAESKTDIYAQRIDTSGTILWPAEGVALFVDPGSYPEFSEMVIVSDATGGAIIAWKVEGDASDSDTLLAQRVTEDGIRMWAAQGVTVCSVGGYNYHPKMTFDGASGAIVTWQNGRGGIGISAQRIDANGEAKWLTDGVALCTAPGDQYRPCIAPDGSGGAIIAWDDYRTGDSGTDWDVYAQRVDAAGHTVVATLLQNYAATFSGDRIAITWTLSEIDEGIEFSIERATASDGPFIELPSSAVNRDKLSFTFTDSDWQPNMSYWYRVEYQNDNERKVLFETGPIATPALPLTLYQNSPNPFNPSTTIGYYIPEKCLVKLDVFDVVGARVARLVSSEEASGYHSVEWKGTGVNGDRVASGVYFYRLTAGKKTVSRKMVLLQ
jgi:hypothetical protein